MITAETLAAMRVAGGLKVKYFDSEGNLHLAVNYKVISEQFPSFFDEMLQETVDPIDYEFYKAGYMTYLITPEGDLSWKSTPKWDAIMDL